MPEQWKLIDHEVQTAFEDGSVLHADRARLDRWMVALTGRTHTYERDQLPMQRRLEVLRHLTSVRLAEESEKRRDKERASSSAAMQRHNTWTRWIAVGALVLSVATAIVSYWNTRYALKIQARAYVNVTGLDVQPVADANGKQLYWKIAPIVVNNGNTPTKNLWWTATAGDFDFDLSKGPRIPKPDNLPNATRNRASLAPRQENRHLIELPIDARYTEDLRAQRIRVYVHGALVYQDEFSGEVHITRYCYGLWGNETITGPSGLSYSGCGGNSNCTDEECGERLDKSLLLISAFTMFATTPCRGLSLSR